MTMEIPVLREPPQPSSPLLFAPVRAQLLIGYNVTRLEAEVPSGRAAVLGVVVAESWL